MKKIIATILSIITVLSLCSMSAFAVLEYNNELNKEKYTKAVQNQGRDFEAYKKYMESNKAKLMEQARQCCQGDKVYELTSEKCTKGRTRNPITEEKRNELKEAYERIKEKNPNFSDQKICERVGQKFEISANTVRNHVLGNIEENKKKKKDYDLNYREENKERRKEQARQYRKENKDKISARHRQYYQDHLEKKRQYREVNKEKIRQYREENKERIKEQRRQYREENKERLNEQARQYYQANKDKLSEYARQYYQANKYKISARHKQYKETNKEKIRQRRIERQKEKTVKNKI